MTPFAAASAVQLFCYPLLALWAYAYVRPAALLYPVLALLVAGFAVQLWSVRRDHPRWVALASPLAQAAALLPLLVFANHSPFVLAFALLPALKLDELYGIFPGIAVLILLSAGAAFGEWNGVELAQEWPLLALSCGFITVCYFAIHPSIETSKRALKQFAVVEGLGKLFEGNSDRQAILRWLVEKAVALLKIEFGAVYLSEARTGKLELQASTGRAFESIKDNLLALATGTLEWVVKEGKVYVANDLSLDPRYTHHREQRQSVASLACVPIGRLSGVRGALVCGSTIPLGAGFAESDMELLTLFARYISLVLEQESWGNVHRHLLQELEAVHACCAALTSSLGLEEFLHLIAGLTSQNLDIKEWTLFLFDPKKGEFMGYLSTTAFMEEVHGLTLAWGEGAISQAVIRKESLMIPDISKNPLVSEKENRSSRFLSMMVIPLFKGDTVLGAIQASDTIPRTFSEEEIRFATSLASLASVALDRAASSTFRPLG